MRKYGGPNEVANTIALRLEKLADNEMLSVKSREERSLVTLLETTAKNNDDVRQIAATIKYLRFQEPK